MSFVLVLLPSACSLVLLRHPVGLVGALALSLFWCTVGLQTVRLLRDGPHNAIALKSEGLQFKRRDYSFTVPWTEVASVSAAGVLGIVNVHVSPGKGLIVDGDQTRAVSEATMASHDITAITYGESADRLASAIAARSKYRLTK